MQLLYENIFNIYVIFIQAKSHYSKE